MEEAVALSLFALAQLAVMLFGYGVASAGRRRPKTTATGVGLVVLAGCALIWLGGEVAFRDVPTAWRMVLAGQVLVFVGVPAWDLVLAHRPPDGPLGHRAWMRLLLQYLGACWVFAFLCLPIFVFAMLATAPPGTLR